jgi:hypothetical protein
VVHFWPEWLIRELEMSAAIKLRDDFEADELRALARTVKDASQARRLLAIAAVYDGMDREEAARITAPARRRGGEDRSSRGPLVR